MRRPLLLTSSGASFNMTPMIDVIFQLLIFFLCVSQYQKAELQEAVRLPVASPEQAQSPRPVEETRLIVNVLPDEQMVLAGRVVQLADVRAALQEKRKESGEALEVWIRADRSVPYRAVEPLLTACAENGIARIAFKVTTEAAP